MTPISAAQQFKAVATLRWYLFRNSFRRKGGAGELAARIIIYPVAALILFGVTSAAGSSAYFAATSANFPLVAGIFWAIFALQVVVSINISQPGLSFDPESLIRFPLTFPRYLLVRIFLGLLSASTVIGTVALLAAATGLTLGIRSDDYAPAALAKGYSTSPSIAPIAFALAVALAITNMFFLRMVFAWVDRWLSTRRAREFFTFFIIAFSIGIQYVNVTVNNIGHKYTHAQQAAKLQAARHAYAVVSPVLDVLPPGLAGAAITHAGHAETLPALAIVLAILVYAAVFLGIFAWRMHREYRGENLSEVNHAKDPPPATVTQPSRPAALAPVNTVPSRIPAPFAANLQKEWIYVRRNPSQFYGLLAPLAMVFLFASRMGRMGQPGLIFPAVAAYSILGVSALAYNILGLDANGVQFYFISPVPFRTIFLSKNIFGFAITLIQLVLLYVLLTFTQGAPPLLLTLDTLCWVIFAALVNVTVGNMRSITTPKKIDPGKISRKQASQLSALLALALMLAAIALGAATLALGRFLGVNWLPIPVFLGLAAGAAALYWAGLNRVDAMAQNHRESLIEELSKTE